MNRKCLKRMVTVCFMLLCVVGTIIVKTEKVEAVRFYSDEDLERINGTYYYVDTVKKVTYKNGKMSITGKLKTHKKTLKSKKRTFKVAKKIRVYFCESSDGWEFSGKMAKAKFAKSFVHSCKQYKARRFPFILFWVKKGTIVAYALSA